MIVLETTTFVYGVGSVARGVRETGRRAGTGSAGKAFRGVDRLRVLDPADDDFFDQVSQPSFE